MRTYPLNNEWGIEGLKSFLLWVCRIVAALIMIQSLYFKFTAHPQSIFLFTTLGIEPWGRIIIGVFELIASLLILYPRTTLYGALTGAGLMAGAIFSHLTKLGIVFDGDAWLFIYAVIVLICCSILIVAHSAQILRQGKILIKNLSPKD